MEKWLLGLKCHRTHLTRDFLSVYSVSVTISTNVLWSYLLLSFYSAEVVQMNLRVSA